LYFFACIFLLVFFVCIFSDIKTKEL